MSIRSRGIKKSWISGCCMVVCAIASASVNAQTCGELPTDILHPADDEGFGSFGGVMAISGDRVVVGSRFANVVGNNSGIAYVFEFDGEQWVEGARLLPSDIEDVQEFGTSVAIDRDILVVGAPGDGPGHTGAVYVFRFDGTEWVEEAKILSLDPDNDDWFGRSVAVENDTVMVGVAAAESGSGAVYVFEFDGSAWIQEIKLLGTGGAQARFGTSVVLSNGLAAIGAQLENQDAGAVFLYQEEKGTWQEQAILTASDANVSDGFGSTISISGDLLVVGAPGNEDVGNGGGALYVFRHDGVEWVEEQILFATDGIAFLAGFGESVAVNKERIVIGDPGNGGYIGELFAGAVYVFIYDGTQWVEEAKLAQRDAQSSQFFGGSVGIGNGSVLAGSFFSNGAGPRSGAVFEYNISALGIQVCPVDFNGNCVLDFFDVSAFIQLFINQDPAGDLTNDGIWDFFDVSAFLAAFAAGCP